MSTKTTRDIITCGNYTITTLFNAATGTTVKSSSTSVLTADCSSTRTGSSNPGWKRQIRLHQNATTALSGSRQTAKYSKGHYHQLYKTVSSNDTHDTESHEAPNVSAPSQTLPSYTTALSNASRIFYSNARKAQRSFQGGTFFGEIAETISMIKHPAQSFRKGVSSFMSVAKKRMTKGRPPRKIAGKILADSWLEFAFGWRPLISDVQDGARAMAHVMSKHTSILEHVSGSYYEDSAASTTFATPVSITTTISGCTTTVAKSRVSAKCYGAVKIADNELLTHQINRQFGFTLSDIAPTAWELIPWSFLIDYFTNVGSIIDAASFPKADIAWSAYCIKRSNERKIIQRIIPGSIPVGTVMIAESGTTGSAIRTYDDIMRVSGAIPIPSFTIHLPFCNTQWTNIGALILGRQSGPKFSR